MSVSPNPFLGSFPTPDDTVPFRKIKPNHFEPAIKIKIKEAKKVFRKIIKNSSAPTFENTLLPIELKYDEISRLGLILFNLDSAETNPEIQDATKRISPVLTRYMSQIMLNKRYFNRIQTIYRNRSKDGLGAEEKRLVEITYSNMKRNGASLPAMKKVRLTRIQIKLSKLNLLYNDHLLAETNDFEYHTFDKNDLRGLPENELEAAAHLAQSKGKKGWIISLQYPSYGPFMKYAENRELREKIYRAYTSRCNRGNKSDNNRLIKKISSLRYKQAAILGYKNYAEYVLEECMAQRPAKVKNLLDDLHKASKPFAVTEVAEVKKQALKLGHKGELMPWDFYYYSEKLKEKKFAFDEAVVKPYFKLENVIEGVFGLATTLYGITFRQVKHLDTYHNDVATFEVYDQDGQYLAILYTDFHPRESKQGGAWMTEYRAQSNVKGEMKRPHISICCNFTKPTANKPSLLTFSEVTTFLHEFGHALHGMLANTNYPSLSGTNVYRDFVELPSQLMENWATEKEWLQKFAFHYETGAPIPEELIQKLIDARNFQAGYLSERQLGYAFLDMAWHELETPFKQSVERFERENTANTQLLPHVANSCISTSFSHIFAGGYAAGYYGYKWAEVLDADAFAVFQEKGIFNSEVAGHFRKEILEKGGTVHPEKLYHNFRGREPQLHALLKRTGLS